MAYSRWHNSDWYIWAEHAKETHGEALMIWHSIDANGQPQRFFPQQIRKMLKHGNFEEIRHFDRIIVPYLERWINECS
jgi:hypothetical protein